MKKMKKFLSMLIAATMTLAMAAPSFAANEQTEPDKGKIVIENATMGKDYTLYKLFDADPSGAAGSEDKDAPISYTATQAQQEYFENVTDNPFTFTLNNKGTYTVTLTDDTEEGRAVAINVLKGLNLDNESVFSKMGEETATDNSVVFNNIPFGYYFVKSSLGATVTITSTNKNATILDKNQNGPGWDDEDNKGGKKIINTDAEEVDEEGQTKKVSVVSANFGDTVNFEVKFHATNYNGTTKIGTYYVKDVLASGMSYVLDKDNAKPAIKVQIGDGAAVDAAAENINYNETENSFELTIPWYENDEFLYNSSEMITITYSAIVDTDANIAGIDGGNRNEASFTYTPVDSTEKEPTKDEWKDHAITYTFALAINKTDKEGNTLAGAEFEVLAEDGSTPIYVVKDDTSDENVYLLDTRQDAQDKSNKVVSVEGTPIVIKGVKAGNYVVKETKAPTGYNLLTQSQTIAASMESRTDTTTTKTVYYNEEGNVVEEVTDISAEVSMGVPASLTTIVNFAGTMLPSTGGIGTTIFYAAGIILMAGAVFFVVRRKRA